MEPLQQHGPGILRQGLVRLLFGIIGHDLPQGRILQGLQRQKRCKTCILQLVVISLQIQLALPGEALLGLAAVPLHQQQPQRPAPVLPHQRLHPLAQLLGVLLHIVGNQQRGLGQFGGQRGQVSVIPPGQPPGLPAWGQLLLQFIGQSALAAAARPHDGPPAKCVRHSQKFLQPRQLLLPSGKGDQVGVVGKPVDGRVAQLPCAKGQALVDVRLRVCQQLLQNHPDGLMTALWVCDGADAQGAQFPEPRVPLRLRAADNGIVVFSLLPDPMQ